jgi:hypothetical protein
MVIYEVYRSDDDPKLPHVVVRFEQSDPFDQDSPIIHKIMIARFSDSGLAKDYAQYLQGISDRARNAMFKNYWES